MELSRRPRYYVKNGIRCYCSRACGGDCRYAAYTLAVANSKRLVKSLGKGWKAIVHENLGWHFHAIHTETKASMHRHGVGYVWVQVMVGRQQFHCERATPKAALKRLRCMLADARRRTQKVEKSLWN